jgi:hypothetical protein
LIDGEPWEIAQPRPGATLLTARAHPHIFAYGGRSLSVETFEIISISHQRVFKVTSHHPRYFSTKICAVRKHHLIRGKMSYWWKGGGDGSVHSRLVAPAPQGLPAAFSFRQKAKIIPAKNTTKPVAEMYDPIDATKFQPAKASG